MGGIIFQYCERDGGLWIDVEEIHLRAIIRDQCIDMINEETGVGEAIACDSVMYRAIRM